MLSCAAGTAPARTPARCASIARTKTAPDQTQRRGAPTGFSERARAGSCAVLSFFGAPNRVARPYSRRPAESPQVPGTNPDASTATAESTSAPTPSRRRSLRRLRERLHRCARPGAPRPATPCQERRTPAARRPRRPLPLPRQTRLYDGHRRRSGFRTRRPRDEKARPRRSLRRSLLPAAPAAALRRRQVAGSAGRARGGAPRSHADRSAASPGASQGPPRLAAHRDRRERARRCTVRLLPPLG